MLDAAAINEGANLYAKNCIACHGDRGQGNTVGPNLTDDYWIHKGSLNDIYLSVKNGYPDKGMQSWAVKFNPKEMSYLASYIKTLRSTNPANPKAPKGDLFTETATDSTGTVKPDSAITVKK